LFVRASRSFLVLLLCLAVQVGLMMGAGSLRAMANTMTQECDMAMMQDGGAMAHVPVPTHSGDDHLPPCCHAVAVAGWIAPSQPTLSAPERWETLPWRETPHTVRAARDHLPPLRPPRDLRA